jgi:hypothetical protein
MGTISSLLGEKITTIEGDWILVTLDANLSEVSTLSATVTSNPVEDGSNIADNAIDDPDEIQIEGLLTDTPADLEDALASVATRAEDAYADLVELKEKKDTVTITTTARVFEDMFIARLNRPRSASIGDAVQFTMTARKIRKVQSSVAEVPVRATKGAKKDLGTKPTTPATPAQEQSLFSKLPFAR